jgi:hypothetical protein
MSGPSSDRERERLDALLHQLYAWMIKNRPPRTSAEDILGAAQRAAEQLLADIAAPLDWDLAQPMQIRALRRQGMLFVGVRLAAQVKEMTSPHIVTLRGSGGGEVHVLATSLVLVDELGEEIETLDVLGESLVDTIERLREHRLELLGRAIVVPGSAFRSKFVFQVEDARRSSSMLDIVCATAEERGATALVLADLARRGVSPLDHIAAELERGLDIVGLEEFAQLRLLIRFVVLQALSAGRIKHAPGALHGIVVGPPGQGKKLVGLAARLINPRMREASAAKISPAGLVGASSRGPEGWRSQAGLRRSGEMTRVCSAEVVR